ncbi:HNH endonuclease [Gordonia sp. CPCC 206044]|uniref:HNH endonuclease n=1 Tax=Gordonia sp. CPCC 206044 TaxID=3140793 RepID=UPI003AF3E879
MFDYNRVMPLDTLIPLLREVTIDADASGRQVFETTKTLMEVRNLVDHQLAVHVAAMDRLGVAQRSGGRTRGLLIEMGAAPAVADRWLRIGTALNRLERIAAYSADGVFSGEHVDALVRGMAHIDQRAPEPLSAGSVIEHELALIAQAFSGATPREVLAAARARGNQIADDQDGVPAAEDRTINEVSTTVTGDGRLEVFANLDIVTGEKFVSAVESLSKKRPEPDGSDDARSKGQRRADALEMILDAAAKATRTGDADMVVAPKTQVSVTVPADHPDRASLEWLGPVSQTTAHLVACDSAVTVFEVDEHGAPLGVSNAARLFTVQQRRALIVRDHCCVKCGAAAGYTQCHHIIYWSHGGATVIDNGCLLCTACHAQIHASDWEIIMGADRHPWLIPPAEIDPTRTPLPAYNRRTMTLAA